MVNNLDGKLENSKIPAVVASDVNDDEVEIDLRDSSGSEEKNPADSDGSVDRWMWCRSIYAVYDDTNL